MKTNYYFLSTVLPALSLDSKPDFTFDEYLHLLELNLTKKDFGKIQELLFFIDLQNLKAFWMEKPLDPRGNLDEKRLEEVVLVEDYFPKFVFDYLNEYQDNMERMKHFYLLLTKFFQMMSKNANYFLSNYFTFERNLHLILCALRSKKHRRDLSKELAHEDQTDFLIKDMIDQKEAESYEPPPEFIEVKELFGRYLSHPEKLNRALLEYRLQKIDYIITDHQFTIDEMLGYTAKFLIIEDYERLNEAEGKAIVDTVA